jgi:hypothetical protein
MGFINSSWLRLEFCTKVALEKIDVLDQDPYTPGSPSAAFA